MKKALFSVRQALTITFVAAALLFVSSVSAQTSVDQTFNPILSQPPSNTLPPFVLQPDGKILIYNFNSVRIIDGVPKNQIARLNADGTLDSSFDCPTCDFNITLVLVQPDGKILVGGGVQGVARLRRLNADGSLDGSFVLTSANIGSISDIGVIQPDGKILVSTSGSFQGNIYYNVYRLNANGSLDDTFMVISLGNGLTITQIRLPADGKILVSYYGGGGGRFTGFLYRFNSNGTRDTTFESPSLAGGSSFSSTAIYDFDVLADGSIIIGGLFDSVNSISRVGVAKILPAGNVDTSFGQSDLFLPGTSVSQIKSLSDGKILITKVPSPVASQPQSLVRLNADGTLDTTFNTPGNVTSVSRWAVNAQGKIVLNVQIMENDTTVFRAARLNSNGSLDAFLNVSNARVGNVSALASQSDGKVILSGDFGAVGGIARRNFARVNADGSPDATFDAGTGFDVAPTRIVAQADGKILVGGGFSNYNGTPRTGIVRLNTDGSVDNNFNIVLSAGNSSVFVYAVALRGDGKIYTGGTFSTVNGQSRTAVARLNADGSLDTTFNPVIGGIVRSIALQTDGKVLIGGFFTGVNGFNRSNLVRLNADGSLDTTFNPGSISGVYQVEVQADGKYVVSTGLLLRLNTDGTTDSSFQSPNFTSSENNLNLKFILTPDGGTIVGGSFNTVNNIARANIVRLRANGTPDDLFLQGGANGAVNDLARTADGKVLVGGAFTRINGATKIGAARLNVSAINYIAKPFDYDGDGRADLSVFRPSVGTWYIARPTGNPAQNFDAVRFGQAGDTLVPADYDGDGKTDVAVFRSGVWYLSRSTLGYTGVQFGQTGDIPVPADYDGDGRADIAVFRPSESNWYLLQSTAGFSGVNFGLASDKPVPGDYNGDGRADLAVFRPSNGNWYIARPTGNPAQNYDAITFGANGDLPTPADYDGDGKTDVAVFRPSNGTWYLNRSTAGFTGIQYGQAGDLPTAADYDGDGKADVAVFRGGAWYLNRTSAGVTGISFGDPDDKPTPNAFVR